SRKRDPQHTWQQHLSPVASGLSTTSFWLAAFRTVMYMTKTSNTVISVAHGKAKTKGWKLEGHT
ncbi:hypothetical protein NL476_27810, partial [Klebsiella pneumoniae]|nr:hypothetical protein [Klebsiella pneumoniae]